MRIVLATDAWHPQVNGVVRVNVQMVEALQARGHEVLVISPDGFRTYPLPSYPEIRLAWRPGKRVQQLLREFAPEAVHIATEGPIGLATRRYCRQQGWAFTTHVHTRFPEYVQVRTGLPLKWGYAFMRWFHGAAERVLVPTVTVNRDLQQYGLTNTIVLPHGVDCTRFHPRGSDSDLMPADWPRPIFTFVGRVAVEKNIEAFLDLTLPGSKVVCGVGPELERLKQQYPEVKFLGILNPEALAAVYRSSDVFVFPSRTDTFGLVLLEAMACGTPVAAYPVAGPLDVVGNATGGILREDLQQAAIEALSVPRELPRLHAMKFSWETTADQFIALLAPVTPKPNATISNPRLPLQSTADTSGASR